MTSDALLCPAHERIELGFSHSVFAERVVIGMNFDGAQRDDLVTVENSDVFTFRGALQK